MSAFRRLSKAKVTNKWRVVLLHTINPVQTLRRCILAEIILPQSYLQRQAAMKKAGIFTSVTWRDAVESSITLDEFKTQLAPLRTENLIALISMISIIQEFPLESGKPNATGSRGRQSVRCKRRGSMSLVCWR
jgi:hypothetical protein